MTTTSYKVEKKTVPDELFDDLPEGAVFCFASDSKKNYYVKLSASYYTPLNIIGAEDWIADRLLEASGAIPTAPVLRPLTVTIIIGEA